MTDRPGSDNEMNGAETLLAPARAMSELCTPAIISGDRTISYPDLDKAVCRAGHALRALGVDVGQRVLMVADDHPEFLFTYLGAMKIGAVPVALNLRITPEDLAFIIDDSEAVLLACDTAFLDLCKAALETANRAPSLLVIDDAVADLTCLATLMAGYPDTISPVMCAPDAMAFWLYTSGTTGQPKAVVHMQKALATVERYLGPVYGVGPGDKIFCSSKLFFAFSLGHVLFAGLRLGASMILHAGWPSGAAVQKVIEDARPDFVFSVPTLYRTLVAENRTNGDAFHAVRQYISAGEKLPAPLLDRWLALTGHPILEGIGATEALIMFIGNAPDDYQPGSSGKPFPQTDVCLKTEGGDVITASGVPGVLWVRCGSVAHSYWKQPDLTAAAFRDGWYRTGDVLMRDDEGRFSYQGRTDDMLKISGQWVSPSEIEDKVLADPNVVEAAVIGVENEAGFIRLALCLVPKVKMADPEPFEQALCDSMSQSLSIYKCPRRFIYLDELPRTATGKLQRFRLRQIASDYMRHGDDYE